MSVSGLSLSETVIPAGEDHRLILSFAEIEGALVAAHFLVRRARLKEALDSALPMTTVIITEKAGHASVSRKIRTLIPTYAIVLFFPPTGCGFFILCD
jgi:hypothetical protein